MDSRDFQQFTPAEEMCALPCLYRYKNDQELCISIWTRNSDKYAQRTKESSKQTQHYYKLNEANYNEGKTLNLLQVDCNDGPTIFYECNWILKTEGKTLNLLQVDRNDGPTIFYECNWIMKTDGKTLNLLQVDRNDGSTIFYECNWIIKTEAKL